MDIDVSATVCEYIVCCQLHLLLLLVYQLLTRYKLLRCCWYNIYLKKVVDHLILNCSIDYDNDEWFLPINGLKAQLLINVILILIISRIGVIRKLN